ncbi:hypothetical protein B0H34DRAFT_702931 [Crassisporium funariophilum]|nr:hypothetical protein B0H34DRAFT_702931 [Crassisporium funariophilum]
MKLAILFAIFTTAVLASPTQQDGSFFFPPPPHQITVIDPVGSTCFWSGTATFCAGACNMGYTEVGRDRCGDGACCITGSKARCCK